MIQRPLLPSPAANQWSERAILAEFRRRAPALFPDFNAELGQVRCLRTRRRRFSTIYELQAAGATATHDVVVKVTAPAEAVISDTAGQHSADCVRYWPAPDPKGYEAAALLAIQQHFQQLGDARLQVLALLDQWFDGWALVMQRAQGPTLGQTLARRTIARRGLDGDLLAAFCRAGGWLRHFHRMPPPSHAETDGFDPQQRCRQWEGLARTIQQKPALRFARRAAGRLVDEAHRRLAADLPCGVSHEDYAPRNVFLTRGGVSAIDTLCQRTAPRLDDVGHFLADLRCHKLRLLAADVLLPDPFLAQWEQKFLQGYYSQCDVPWHLVRLFELAAVLTRLAAWQWECENQSGTDRIRRRLFMRIGRSSMEQYLDHLVGQLDQEVDLAPSCRTRPRPLDAAPDQATRQVLQIAASALHRSTSEPCQTRLDRIRRHRFSTLIYFTVEQETSRRCLVAKVPRNPYVARLQGDEADRPRLLPVFTAEDEARLEFAALQRIQRHLMDQPDRMLRAVTPCLHLDEVQAVVMEEITAPTLAQVARAAAARPDLFLQSRSVRAFRRSGRWLRALHDLPAPTDCTKLLARRHQVLHALQRLGRHLPPEGRAARDWHALLDRGLKLAERVLPDPIPVALAHADFAPQNVFVFDDGGIAAGDTLGNLLLPPELDVAHFLYLVRRQIRLGRRRRTLQLAWEQSFLAGYFAGQAVPWSRLRVFELLVLLDHWCSSRHGVQTARGWRSVGKAMRDPFRRRRFLQHMQRLIDDAASPRPAIRDGRYTS